jgi:hypothetical protein
MINGIFKNHQTLEKVLRDSVVGVPTVTKILSALVYPERDGVVKAIEEILTIIDAPKTSPSPYKRLWNELSVTPPVKPIQTFPSKTEKISQVVNHQDYLPKHFNSPSRVASQAAERPPASASPTTQKGYLPTPTSSPTHYYPGPNYVPAYYPMYSYQGQYYYAHNYETVQVLDPEGHHFTDQHFEANTDNY